MFDNFIKRVCPIDFEDYGSFQINSADGDESLIKLDCSISIDDEEDFPKRWTIECFNVRGQLLRLGYVGNIDFFDEHVLLMPFSTSIQRLSFYGKFSDPHSVVGMLYERHKAIVGDWIPFDEYLNGFEIATMIEGGFGILAEGPAPLISAYSDVLRQFGITTAISGDRDPSYWDGSAFVPYKVLYAMTFDDCFVIAESFDAKVV